MGFGVEVKFKENKQVVLELFKQVELEDLVKYGLIFEFIGCLLVVISFEEFNEEVLIQILKELKNVIIKQYGVLFVMEDIELEFCEDVLFVIVKKVMQCKIGV